VIVHANQRALEGGSTVERCLDLAGRVTKRFDIPFLIMTYYNIPFRYNVDRFVSAMADRNLQGAIIPDLPPEEGKVYLDAMQGHDLAPILIFSPATPVARMRYLAGFGRGFIYCVARKGVTGEDTDFSSDLSSYLDRCREATSLPLALGFGLKEKADVDFLREKADIAVVGSQTIRVMKRDGIHAVEDFIRGLR
jgi:tryptophan synthase alpha chain